MVNNSSKTKEVLKQSATPSIKLFIQHLASTYLLRSFLTSNVNNHYLVGNVDLSYIIIDHSVRLRPEENMKIQNLKNQKLEKVKEIPYHKKFEHFVISDPSKAES